MYRFVEGSEFEENIDVFLSVKLLDYRKPNPPMPSEIQDKTISGLHPFVYNFSVTNV